MTEPKDTAFVTKPGPLLEDVMHELAQQRDARSSEQREEKHESSIALVDEARAAFIDECDEVIEHDAMRFDDDANSGNAGRHRATPSADKQERQERVVVHRFDKRDNNPATAPRRVITLRDKRRGRPRIPNGKHGADPPV